LSGGDLHGDYNGQDFWNSSQGAAVSQTRSYFGLKVPLTAAEREAFAPQWVTGPVSAGLCTARSRLNKITKPRTGHAVISIFDAAE
jgi:hypothetical protein